jgi:hypothetical protein
VPSKSAHGVLLTLQKPTPKSNGKVSGLRSNLYARWRTHSLPIGALQEAADGGPPERLLQQIWQHQRLQRDQLKTLDGKPVRVLHPGFWNHEAGPDFRDAILKLADDPPRIGDVEIDLHPAGWRGHSHDRNPAYANVILHVVWDADARAQCPLPTLALKSRLDAPLNELRLWLDSGTETPALLQGRCSAPLRGLTESVREEILRQAAMVRLQRKATELGARARLIGWEQALWEGIFVALGYKHNAWPMRCVAELLPHLLEHAPSRCAPVFSLQARLLGVSGLLPTELACAQSGSNSYLRRVWDFWWREREELAGFILPRALWDFGGQRPANHPQRRLAVAAHWLAGGNLPMKLEKWFTTTVADRELEQSLLEVLQVGRDEFWSWHWTFRSARLAKPQLLIGVSRVTDLAVNVVLPWFWMRAASVRNDAMQAVAESRYLVWPKGEDNAVLRLARQRLMASAPARALGTAAMQQGLLQIARDFCERSNALCENCRFPELVRGLSSTTS